MAKDHLVDETPATPPTLDQLRDAIAQRVQHVEEVTPDVQIDLDNYDEFSDGYIKCIEAMRDAAVMAFNYVASQMGVTGFQASVAALQTYGMIMHIDGPFRMLQLQDALYPQSNPVEQTEEWLRSEGSRQWLQEKVAERLGEASLGHVHPHVRQHWVAILKGAWPQASVQE